MTNTGYSNPLTLITPIPDDFFDYQNKQNIPVEASSAKAMLGQSFYVHDVKRGGMGEVFLCSTKPAEKASVALKTFQKQFFYNPVYRISFENEVVNWSRLSGLPHIMPVVGIEEFDNRVYVAMPCIHNSNGIQTFRDELQTKTIPVEKKLSHFQQCLLGLLHANQRFGKLVHGDIKPENMMIMGDNVYITDFGLCRTVEDINDPQIKINIDSTWAYKAPELWKKGNRSSVESDVYALGIILYEILTGKLPFIGNSKSSWEEAHTKKQPQLVQFESRNRKYEPFVKLVAKCLNKNPRQRPDYPALYEAFSKAWKKADILEHFVALTNQVPVMEFFASLQNLTKRGIIRGLLKLNRADLALEEINNLEPEVIIPDILHMKGSSLSLMNRDHEAISVFQDLLQQQISPGLKTECINELGLSYKRTKQFDKAERIYLDELLPNAKKEEIPTIIGNLATVYLYKEDFKKAIACLSAMLREHPGSAEGWANLGMAHTGEQDYEKAAGCFKKALAIKPGFANVQTELAKAYLYLGRTEESYALLDSAWQQGYFTMEWLEHMIIVCQFTNKESETEELIQIAVRDLGKEKTDDILKSCSQIVKNIRKFYESKTDTIEDDSQGNDEYDDTDNDEHNYTESDTGDAYNTAGAASGSQVFSIPFLNFMYYMSDSSYSIDFYDDVQLPGEFAQSFQKSYNQSKNDPRVKLENMQLRSSVFYFTECPDCKMIILTNRDVGRSLSCRRCDYRFPTAVLSNPSLNALLGKCTSLLQLKVDHKKDQSVLVVIQPYADYDISLLKNSFFEEGYKERDANNKQVIYLFTEMVKRNLFVPTDSVLAFEKDFPSGVNGYEGQTPAEVDWLIRKLRSRFRNLRSSSAMYDTNPDDYFSLLMIGKNEQALAKLEEQIQKEPDDFDLLCMKIVLCNEMNRLEESLAMADRLLDKNPDKQTAWSVKGETLVKAGKYEKAIPYLQTASKMDPLDTSSLVSLAKCYHYTSNAAELNKVVAKLKSMGMI